MHEIDYRYLRPQKAAALRRWHEEPFEKRESLAVWKGERATILPVRKTDRFNWTGRGGVVDQHGNSVELSATRPCVDLGYDFENPEYRDEKVVYCGYLIHHWGHFLVEGVARLWYFLEQDPSVDKYVFVLDENEERELRGNYREFLTLLNIWDRLEIINRPTTYREVLVPELGFRCRKYFSPKFLEVFNTVAQNVVVDPSWKPLKKIYWSRSQLAKHGEFEFGFEALDDFFQRNGYVVLFPEKVPLSEMIYYIRSSDVIASVSGSLPHNMFFGRQGQKIEIVERCVLNNDWQSSVNRMKELKTTYIDANIAIYTVSMCGPFIMGYNDQLQAFAADRGFDPPAEHYTTKKHWKACFCQYMKAYQDQYRYQWFMEDYLVPETDYHLEAYQDGFRFYRDYLEGRRPFRWHHYLEIHYWKQFIKRLLKRA